MLRGTPQMRKIATDIFAEFGARHYARAHVLRALSAMLLGLVARALAAEHGADARARPAPIWSSGSRNYWTRIFSIIGRSHATPKRSR